MRAFKILAVALFWFLWVPFGAQAAEVKLLSSLRMMPVFKTLAGDFERTTGNKLVVTFDEAVPARNRILAGEAADVTINLQSLFDELEAKGKIVKGSRATVAHSTISVVVGPGAPKPDISSGQALKTALLSARSVTYGNPAHGGAAGIVITGVLQRLKITDEIKAKATLARDGREVVALVAAGRAEIGMTQTSMALSRNDLTYVGTLPRDALSDKLWGAGAYSIGVVAGTKELDAARSMVHFMSSPAAIRALKAKGMEP